MTRVDWSEAAALALLEAAGSRADLEDIAEDVRRGDSLLLEVSGVSRGFLVLRLEETSTGSTELVLVAGAGIGARAVIALVKEWAARYQVDKVRTHITRPGLERIYTHLGFSRAEVVMTWRPGDGQ